MDGEEPVPTPRKKPAFLPSQLTDEERKTVFEIWAMLADRSPTTTAKIAKRDYQLTLDPKMISVWANRYGWVAQARTLYHDIAPTMMERTRASLVGGGPAAAAYLQQVADGRIPPNRDRTVASVALLDRIGFLPHTRRDAERGGGTPVNAVTDGDPLDLMSDDQLKEIAAGRLREG